MWQDVVKALSKTESVVADHLQRGLSAIDTHLRGAQEREAQIQQSVVRALQELDTQLAETLEALGDERHRTAQRLEELMHELQEHVQRGAAKLAAAMERREDRVGARMQQAIRELIRELRDLPGGRPAAGDGALRGHGSSFADDKGGGGPRAAESDSNGEVGPDGRPHGSRGLSEHEEKNMKDLFEGEE